MAELSRRLDLLSALGAAAQRARSTLRALLITTVPPRGMAVVLFAVAPVCALFALVILEVRARCEAVPALSWVAGGLLVVVTATVLQLISFPAVSPGGGVLGTGSQSSAGLYLLFHVALAGGATAGALALPLRWRAPLVAAGVVLAVLLAVNAITLPELLRPDGSFTPTLAFLEFGTAVVTGLCTLGGSGAPG